MHNSFNLIHNSAQYEDRTYPCITPVFSRKNLDTPSPHHSPLALITNYWYTIFYLISPYSWVSFIKDSLNWVIWITKFYESFLISFNKSDIYPKSEPRHARVCLWMFHQSTRQLPPGPHLSLPLLKLIQWVEIQKGKRVVYPKVENKYVRV